MTRETRLGLLATSIVAGIAPCWDIHGGAAIEAHVPEIIISPPPFEPK